MKPYLFIVRGTQERSRSRGKRILATSYSNALGKITSMYPNKLIQTKYAKPMDLITAKVQAAHESRVNSRTVYINVHPKGHKDEGDCFLHHVADKTTYTAFKNGSEIAVPSDAYSATNKPEPVVKGKQLKKVEGFTPTPLPAKNIKDKPANTAKNIPLKTVEPKVAKNQNTKAKVEGAEVSVKTNSPSTQKTNSTIMTTTTKSPAKKVSAPVKKTVAAVPAKSTTAAPKNGKKVTMTAKQLREAVIAGAKVYTKTGVSIPFSKRAAEEPAKKYEVLAVGAGKDRAFHLV
jgi:hypothetical protein